MSNDASAPGRDKPARQVLVTWPDYDLEAEGMGASLARAGLSVRLEPKRGVRRTSEMRVLLDGAAGAIVSTDPFDADLLRECPSLKVIARVGVGVDSIDLEAATRCGIAVTVTPGANEETVADHTIALMLAWLRRMCEHDAGVRAGHWNRTGSYTPLTLHGRTVGLVGLGRIGQLVAQRLRGFDVEVLATDPANVQLEGVRSVPLAELLACSQVVSLHVPLLPETRGLIGGEELDRMRPDAILVNTARGAIVDEGALIDALARGTIKGAALDVFEEEPPRAEALFARHDVVLSPHNAGLSVESVQEMTRRATASVIDVLTGRRPADLANPEVLGGQSHRAPAGDPTMMADSLHEAIAAGDSLAGTVLTLPGAATAELLSEPFDVVWVDLEHAALGPLEAQEMILGAQATGAYAMVRLRADAVGLITQALDAGADGIVVADVREPGTAAQVVELSSHPPQGRRGWGPRRLALRGRTEDRAPVAPSVWVQIEGEAGVAAAAEIAAVPGIDVICIGAADLSVSLEVPFDLESDAIREAVKTVREACEAHGVAFGLAGALEGAPEDLLRSAPILIHSTDAKLSAQALDAAAAWLRGILDPEQESSAQ